MMNCLWFLAIFFITQVLDKVSCHLKSSKSHPQAVVADYEFSSLVKKLWSLDKNRLQFNTDLRLSYQGRLPWYDNGRDAASYPLFYHVNNDILKKPTYKAFIALLDNYNRESGIKEVITNRELSENYNFLHQVLNTPVMKEVYAYLKRKGKASPILTQFKHQLYDLWFKSYYRSSYDRVQDSSGFEHVFVGEINRGKDIVSGFHNWIQFYLQEKSKHMDYQGYLKKDSASNYLLMTRFKWYNKLKVIGSSFVGVSPEFEFSLYTLVFMMGLEEIQFKLDGMDVKITCFGIMGRKRVGTCYPDLL